MTETVRRRIHQEQRQHESKPRPSNELLPVLAAVGTLYGLTLALPAQASSHREAPSITATPKVDGTDFYMFNSYEGVAANGTRRPAT